MICLPLRKSQTLLWVVIKNSGRRHARMARPREGEKKEEVVLALVAHSGTKQQIKNLRTAATKINL